MRIQHEVLKGRRAEYGEQIIAKLATDLAKKCYLRSNKKCHLRPNDRFGFNPIRALGLIVF